MTDLRERIEERLRDTSRVSVEQRAVAIANGNLWVKACPGSGKTYTIGLRIAWQSTSKVLRPIAATSYTNTAIAEMHSAAQELGVSLGHEHFVGTLHSMLLKYVFYPFGHLVMGCTRTPTLITDDAARPPDFRTINMQPGSRVPLSIWDAHYRADGTLEHRSANPNSRYNDQTWDAKLTEIQQRKAQVARAGFASYSDSMYYAQQVLATRPEIARAVARRFHEIIVDEYQDTADTQLECVRLLHATGELQSLVLVGDLDQSIFSFSGADPSAADQFATNAELAQLPLSSTFRCSQRICAVAANFTATPNATATAAGASKDCDHQPRIVRYDPEDLDPLLEGFHGEISARDIEVDQAVVLAFGNDLVNRLNGRQGNNASAVVRHLGSVVARSTARINLEPRDIRRLEALLASIAWDVSSADDLDVHQRAELRVAALSLLPTLPGLNLTMADWTGQARSSVDATVGRLVTTPARQTGRVIQTPRGAGGRLASELFGIDPTNRIVAKTIHRAKGETHEAVLLVATARGATTWIGRNGGTNGTEPMRRAYVGLTRARQIANIALPNSIADTVIAQYEQLGFAAPQ